MPVELGWKKLGDMPESLVAVIPGGRFTIDFVASCGQEGDLEKLIGCADCPWWGREFGREIVRPEIGFRFEDCSGEKGLVQILCPGYNHKSQIAAFCRRFPQYS